MANKTSNSNSRRWWLQLQFAFFSDKRIRALRRKYGDLALIIYQKMMLKSLENDCYMKYEGLEDTFEDEIAVDIIEDEPEKVELIRKIVDFLIKHELMIEEKDYGYFFPQAFKMSGSETSSAERMRRKRERDEKNNVSQCDGDVSQCDGDVSHCEVIITETDTDIHLKSNNNKTLDDISKTETDTEQADADSVSADRRTSSAAAEAEPPDGDLFSVEQLMDKAKRNKVNLTDEGVKEFHKEMQETGWILYGKPIEKRSIIKSIRGWAKYHTEYKPEPELNQGQKPEAEPPNKTAYDYMRELGMLDNDEECKEGE